LVFRCNLFNHGLPVIQALLGFDNTVTIGQEFHAIQCKRCHDNLACWLEVFGVTFALFVFAKGTAISWTEKAATLLATFLRSDQLPVSHNGAWRLPCDLFAR